MLVVDNNKSNLLRMKEKLLEVGVDLDKNLNEFKQLALEIDDEVFNSLMKKIENTNLHNLSLEEQLVILNQIEEEYNGVYELQCRFRNVFQKYSQDELELSDLNVILIDDIRNRINTIQGYLINIKSIKNGKEDLEKLNQDLINESKRKDNLFKKFSELEDELKSNFLNAEGRNYDANGNLVYSSIVTEYKNVSLDLKELLENSQLLDSEIDKINELKRASDEEISAAKICYDRMPTNENKDVFEAIKHDALQVNYKLALLYIANLVAKECSEYSSIVLKRKQILSLNEERLNCLRQLGVKISIDPFARIRINEQIQIISTLGDNSDQIEVIKRNIGNLDRLIEEKTKDNNEFTLELSNELQLLRKPVLEASSSNLQQVFDVDNPTKVINVKDLTDEIRKNKNKISEQTDGVIKRVNAMLHENDVISNNDVSSGEVIPTLVVEPSIETPLFDNHVIPTATVEEVPESIIDADNNQIEVSGGLLPVFKNSNIAGVNQEIVPDVNTAEIKANTLTFEDDSNNIFNDDILPGIDLSTQDVTSEANETKTEEEKVEFEDDSNNIFNDAVTPFESVALFNDRVSDEDSAAENNLVSDTINLDSSDSSSNSMSSDSNNFNSLTDDSLSNAMPEMFWMVDEPKEDLPKDNNEAISFDSQVDALMGKVKIKEKVL